MGDLVNSHIRRRRKRDSWTQLSQFKPSANIHGQMPAVNCFCPDKAAQAGSAMLTLTAGDSLLVRSADVIAVPVEPKTLKPNRQSMKN
jgi:hypothetical protein